MNHNKLKALIEDHGEDAVKELVKRIQEGEVTFENCSFKQLAESFGYDTNDMRNSIASKKMSNLTEANWTMSRFSVATGELLIREVRVGWERAQRVMPFIAPMHASNVETERTVAINANNVSQLTSTAEGVTYPQLDNESSVIHTPAFDKIGGYVSVTYETAKFDKTNQIIMQARNLGEVLATKREKDGIEVLEDANSTSFYPVQAADAADKTGSGTATGLYRPDAGANWWDRHDNFLLANQLVDWTDIDNALQAGANMTDQAGEKVSIDYDTIIVPRALLATANYIVNSISNREIQGSHTMITGNPLNGLRNGAAFRVLWSPHLTSQDDWFMVNSSGLAFGEQVIEDFNIEQDTPNILTDVLFTFRGKYHARYWAYSPQHVVKSSSDGS